MVLLWRISACPPVGSMSHDFQRIGFPRLWWSWNVAVEAALLWTVWGSSPMRWNTSFTLANPNIFAMFWRVLKWFKYRPHIFWGRCPFLSHEGLEFETLWMWISQSRCRMFSFNNTNTILHLYQPSLQKKAAGFPPAWPTDRSGVLPRWTSWEDPTVHDF